MSNPSYEALLPEIQAHLTGHWLTDCANFSAFVMDKVPGLNWAGFYFNDGKKLILGPFVGKPACTEISYERGVCGAAYTKREPLLVDDVHEFPGHIACDSASRSEMVLPILVGGECVGVFDIDAPTLARFKEEDRRGIDLWLSVLVGKIPQASWNRRPWA
jgi:L-methionine (R)-S-oxide reductase